MATMEMKLKLRISNGRMLERLGMCDGYVCARCGYDPDEEVFEGTCKKHGLWSQKGSDGCPECYKERAKNSKFGQLLEPAIKKIIEEQARRYRDGT